MKAYDYEKARQLISEAMAWGVEAGYEIKNLSDLSKVTGVSRAVMYETYKMDKCSVTTHVKLMKFIYTAKSKIKSNS